MLPHTEGTVINQSLKIEIFEVKNSSQQNGRYMLPFFFRESYYHKEKIAGVKPDLQQWEPISNTFGTYHNQGFVYLSTRHASDYIEKRIGNLMNSTINRESSVRVHVDIDYSRLFIKTFNLSTARLNISKTSC
jgi:hypothetical protein